MGAPVRTPRKPSLSESYGCTHLEIYQQPVLVVGESHPNGGAMSESSL